MADIFISESVSLILDTKSGKFHLRKDNDDAHYLYLYDFGALYAYPILYKCGVLFICA